MCSTNPMASIHLSGGSKYEGPYVDALACRMYYSAYGASFLLYFLTVHIDNRINGTRIREIKNMICNFLAIYGNGAVFKYLHSRKTTDYILNGHSLR